MLRRGRHAKAEITHFLHLNVSNVKPVCPESIKATRRPCIICTSQERFIFTDEGMHTDPTRIGRVLGTTGPAQLDFSPADALGDLTRTSIRCGRATKHAYPPRQAVDL